ncbi:hypothetical protein ABZ920_02225, partial [Streptomyces sp. NPDC046831]|uniref:hypothetical protein n=1 Tax=Streptomyces sp. NPDC046831 TaxID=3154805 RepID=UPI0033F41AC2
MVLAGDGAGLVLLASAGGSDGLVFLAVALVRPGGVAVLARVTVHGPGGGAVRGPGTMAVRVRAAVLATVAALVLQPDAMAVLARVTVRGGAGVRGFPSVVGGGPGAVGVGVGVRATVLSLRP